MKSIDIKNMFDVGTVDKISDCQLGSVSSRCSRMTLSEGEHGLIPEQRLDTEHYCLLEGPGFNSRTGRELNFGRPFLATPSMDRDVKPLV